MYGKRRTEEAKKKISDYRKRITISEETREKIRSSLTGRKNTEETKRKRAITMTGQTRSDESKKNLANGQKKIPIVLCPHCGRSGKRNAFARHHFDNCKSKV